MSVIPKDNNKRVYENYAPDVKGDFDVIVIGSGMGGMSCASALSILGHKVLVLEQHYIPGGFTHMFGRKGYKWDVGVHVMGEMTEGELPYKMLMWLTNNKVKMNLNADPYEKFQFPDNFDVTMPANTQKFLDSLCEEFPEEKHKLLAYWKTVKKSDAFCRSFFLFQTLPKWLEKVLSSVYHAFIPNYWKMTTASVLDKHGITGKLRLALTSHWGYYGNVPEDSSFAIHALTHLHFGNGAFFPQGGSSSFAAAMLGNVIEAGGKVMTKAEVKEVLVENGVSKGVVMADGTVIKAKHVVSAAGAKSTVNRLVPESFRSTEWAKTISSIKDSPSYLCLNLAFKGDITKLGANGCNRWLYTISSNDVELWDISKKDERPHLLYVSFPSTKDPEHDPGPDEKHTGECVTFVDWTSYEQWSETQFGDRPADYEAFKQEITDRMLAEMRIRMPEIMEHLEFCELSTPLTAKHYTRASQGAIYGLSATPERFGCEELRVRTPIKNFLMSGVDVATVGVVSAMTSGVLTAAVVDKRAYLKLL
jgi:all-trans-retinol 13,14-reductase